MSSLSSYPTKAFKESQKFLIRDPATGSFSYVVGSDLVSYITPKLNYVRSQSTRVAAENTDYKVGTVVQTTGGEAVGDEGSATFLVVSAGQGNFAMLNGNELLTINGVRPKNTITTLSDITSLSSLNTAALVDGQQFYRGEFWPDTGVGAVNIKWDANEPVANHNGGTIIDPAKISELDTVNKTFGTYFTADTVSGNTGCFVVSNAPKFMPIETFGGLALTGFDNLPVHNVIQAAGFATKLNAGVYSTSGELTIADGGGIVGSGAFWKRRTGYVYTDSLCSVILYTGASSTNTTVVRASLEPVGTQGNDFSAPNTDDLLSYHLSDFHIDAGGLADFGCYIYRGGNQSNVGNITAEKSVKANHVHLGCYAAKFGVFGSYESVDRGIDCGWDIFSWGSVEATNFSYSATFLTANNGTGQTYIAGTGTDQENSGGRFSVGRGSVVFLTSEGNFGRACIIGQYLINGGSGGTSDYVLEYLEGNADGPYVNYLDGTEGITLRDGFLHPGNGSNLLPQNIFIRSRNNAGTNTTNAGPDSNKDWLTLRNLKGNLSGIGFDIYSTTYKFKAESLDPGATYSNIKPLSAGNFASTFFKADATLSDTRYEIGLSVSRTGTGQYVLTFDDTQPDVRYTVNAEILASNANAVVMLNTKGLSSCQINTYTPGTSTLVDSGGFLDVIISRTESNL